MKRAGWMPAAVAAMVLFAGPAFAQLEKLDKYSLEQWGGTWMADCASGKGAKIIVAEASLTYDDDQYTIATNNFRGAASWFGDRNAPENYVMALLADQPEDMQLVAIIWKDAKGEYMTIDGDPKYTSLIGKTNLAAKYRKCPAPGAEKAAVAAAANDAAAAASAEMPTASAMLDVPGFKQAYMKAVGKHGKEPWVAELSGPSSPSEMKTVGGVEYTFSNVCMDHDCYENNLVVAYDAAKQAAYGKIYTAGKSAMFGNPKPELAKELGEYWRLRFRSNP